MQKSMQSKWIPDWKKHYLMNPSKVQDRRMLRYTHDFSDIFALYDDVLGKLMFWGKTDKLNGRLGL